MSATVSAQLQFRLPYKVMKGDKYFVATLPNFDISSQGETVEKALRNLAEAASLFFVSCFERGTLETVLLESLVQPPRAPSPTKDAEWLNVPIPLLASQATDAAANA